MWIVVVLVCLSLVAVAISGYLNGKGEKIEGAFILFIAGALSYGAIQYAKYVDISASEIAGEGEYYEVFATTTVSGKGTLVYVIDLDGNKEKTDILAKYPIDGYKIEQVGKRTFLLPESTHVAFDKERSTFLVSKKGEAMTVPEMVSGR